MWFKVDDKFHASAKARKAGLAAIGVWALTGSWCADNGTDGFVPLVEVRKHDPRLTHAQKLVNAGLWALVEVDGEKGYLFHDWLQYQPSASQVRERRDRERERQSARRSGTRPVSDSDAVSRTDRSGNADGSRTDCRGNADGSRAPRKENASVEAQNYESVAAYKTTPEPEPQISTGVDISLSAQTPSGESKPSRKKPATAIPPDWSPSSEQRHKLAEAFPAVAAMGFDERREFFAAEAFKFRNHAVTNDRRCVNWTSAFNNWVANAVGKYAPTVPVQRPCGPLDGYGAGVKTQIGWELMSPTPDPEAVALAEAAGYRPPASGRRLREVGV